MSEDQQENRPDGRIGAINAENIAAMQQIINDLQRRIYTQEQQSRQNIASANNAQQQQMHFNLPANRYQSIIPLPKPIDLNGDVSANMKFFRATWENYKLASGLENSTEQEKIAVLQCALGEDCFKRFSNFPLSEDDRSTSNNLINAIERFIVPAHNRRYERAMFNTMVQNDTETIDEYVNRMKEAIKSCEYNCSACNQDLSDEFLLDRLCISIRNIKLREKLYDDQRITLQDAINKVKSGELTQKQLKELTKEKSEEINRLSKDQYKRNADRRSNNSTYNNNRAQSKHRSNRRPSSPKVNCHYCGGEQHNNKDECPAYGKTCRKCGKLNHFDKVCLSFKQKGYKYKKVQSLSMNGTEDETVLSMNANIKENKIASADLEFIINDEIKIAKCQLDTGATCNVIGYANLANIAGVSNPKLRRTATKIRGFGNNLITPLGQAYLTAIRNGRVFKLNFEVVQRTQPPLISNNSCQSMGLIKICKQINTIGPERQAEKLIEKYADVFDGIGRIATEVSLEIDPSVQPVIQKPRRIPVSLRAPLKDLIAELESEDLIEKVTTHTNWVSNVVLVKRDKLRLCIDPVDLNKALKRVNYQMPTIEEILPYLSNAKVFSTFDATKGFWQIPLDYESSLLTTFWTPQGRYRWKRVPFGISPAPEIFQRVQHEMIEGLPGIECICDDIIVYGCGESYEEALRDHNIKLEKLLQRFREKNLKLNKSKMKLCRTEVSFFGHLLTSEGVRPDPVKTAAITEMAPPNSIKQTHTFLGMVTYLSKFLPNLSSIAEPLRRLCRKDSTFLWSKAEQKCFDTIKGLVTSSPVLQYFDSSKAVTLQCDASGTGLGSVLLQDGKPVAFASRTLTNTERNYAQIEKETLAILFGCMRFEQYIIGRLVTIQSDHKPLEIIFRNPLLLAPKRLQRMLLALQRYNIDLTFIPGSEMYIADLLSRLHLSDEIEETLHNVYSIQHERYFAKEIERIDLLDSLRISDERINEVLRETTNDENMQQLIDLVISGFPDNANILTAELKPYARYRHELTTQNGLIFKGNRLIIPQILRTDMLKRLHTSHSGIEMTQRLARDTMFWPGISQQVRETVERCKACQKFSTNLIKEPMMSSPVPNLPFEIVSMDVCEISLPDYGVDKTYYLVTVDHYSDFFEIDELKNLKASTIVKCCKRNFARHGIPMLVITDNGTHFKNVEFQEFAVNWEFKFATTSPNHPQANGKVEATVGAVKNLLKRAIASDEDIHKALLSWRNTPNKIGSSPTQRLFSRRTRCNIPFTKDQLKPQIVSNVDESIVENKERIKYNFDKSARPHRSLNIGEPVFVKLRGNDSPWTEGTVNARFSQRAYSVDVNGREYRRNRIHIKPQHNSNQDFVPDLNDAVEIDLQRDSNIPKPHLAIENSTSEEQSATAGSQPDLFAEPDLFTNSPQPILKRQTTVRSTDSPKSTKSVTIQDTPTRDRPRRDINLPRRFMDYDMN